MVAVCVLASGSSGNCTLIASERTRVLVDAGVSCKQVTERLERAGAGVGLADVDAVLVSHEHCDHVSGLPVVAKKVAQARQRAGRGPAPVFVTTRTAPQLAWNGYEPALEIFQAGTRLSIGDLEVDTFSVPHDAVDPIGFCFRSQGLNVGLVTDLGYIPESVRYHLRGTNVLILESNHDLEMLKVGPYPWSVKQRVMGRHGHLSNDVAAGFLRQDLDPDTRTVVLAHLSENNNHPALVELQARQALGLRGMLTELVIAGQNEPTAVLRF